MAKINITQSDIIRIYNNSNGVYSLFKNEIYINDPNADGREIQIIFNGLKKNSNKTNRSSETYGDVISSIISKGSIPSYGSEHISLSEVVDVIKSFDKDNIKDYFKSLGNRVFSEIVEQDTRLLTEINRDIGLTGELSEDFRDTIKEASPEVIKLGFSFEELKSSVGKIVEDSGKFKVINQETIETVAKTTRLSFDNMEEAARAIEPFTNVSMGAKDAMDAIRKSSMESIRLGLLAKETTKTIVQNIDKLNQYGFKEGVDGLSRMAQKAQQLRLDLTNVFNLAERVMDPTNALSLVSNLQVIGGGIGDFNDPFKLMYMATNDIEGFESALSKSVETLATFDNETKTFRILGSDLRRARAFSDALGMSLKDVTSLAIQSAQRTSATQDLLSRGFIYETGDVDFLTNLAQMKDGKMTIEISSEELKTKLGLSEIALKEMTEDQFNLLKQYRSELLSMDEEDIISKQFTVVGNIERTLNEIAQHVRLFLGNTFIPDRKVIEDLFDDIKNVNTKDILGHFNFTIDTSTTNTAQIPIPLFIPQATNESNESSYIIEKEKNIHQVNNDNLVYKFDNKTTQIPSSLASVVNEQQVIKNFEFSNTNNQTSKELVQKIEYANSAAVNNNKKTDVNNAHTHNHTLRVETPAIMDEISRYFLRNANKYILDRSFETV